MSITIDFYPCFVSEVLPQPAADAFVAFDRRASHADPVVSPCAVCIACGIFPALRTHGNPALGTEA